MRAWEAWGLCAVCCWAPLGCNRDLRPREPPGTVGSLPAAMDAAAPRPDAFPDDAGVASVEVRPSDAGAGTRPPADAAADVFKVPAPPAHQDGGLPTTVPVRVSCDHTLSPQRSMDGTAGTLPAPGPFHPCGVLGGQSFSGLVFSGDGRRVAALGAGGQVQVLDGGTLAPIATLARARGPYESFAISGDGALVAAANQRDGELDVWRVDDHSLLQAVALPPIWSPLPGVVAISPDGALVAVSQGPDTAVIDVAIGRVTQRLPKSGSCCANALRFADGGHKLAVARFDFWAAGTGSANVWIYDLTSGFSANLITHQDIYGWVQLEVSADGTTLLTSGAEEGIVIWNAAAGTRRTNLTPPLGVSVDILGLNAAGDGIGLLLSDGSTGGGPWLQWRLSWDFSLVSEVQLNGIVTPWALAPRGGLLVAHTPASGGVRQLVTIDSLTHRALGAACLTPPIDYVRGFSRDGTRLLVESGSLPEVLDLASGLPVGPPLVTARGATMSPDGRWVAWAASPGATSPALVAPEFQLVEVETGAQRTLRGQQMSPTAREMLVFSSDSQRLAALNTYDGTLDVVDVPTGQLLRELGLGTGDASLQGFTDDGLAVRIRHLTGEVEIIGWQDGARTAGGTLPPGAVASSDGTVVVTVSSATATVSREGTPISTMPAVWDACVGGFPVAGLSPDGSLVILNSPCSRPQSSTRTWPLTELRYADSGELLQSFPLRDLLLSWDDRKFVSGAMLWCR